MGVGDVECNGKSRDDVIVLDDDVDDDVDVVVRPWPRIGGVTEKAVTTTTTMRLRGVKVVSVVGANVVIQC